MEEEEAERIKELEEGKAQRIAELPGGLDPLEVLESLPEDLKRYYQLYYPKMIKTRKRNVYMNSLNVNLMCYKRCFEEQDTGMLQEVIRKLGEKDARYHMKRCVDSGLWKPAHDDPETNPEDGFR